MDDRLPQYGLRSLLQSLFHCNQIYFQSSKARDSTYWPGPWLAVGHAPQLWDLHLVPGSKNQTWKL